MQLYEIQAENGHRVRVEAEDEIGAFEYAVEVDPDIEMAGVIEADGLPIGHDGGDAEDAIALGESIDNGNYV